MADFITEGKRQEQYDAVKDKLQSILHHCTRIQSVIGELVAIRNTIVADAEDIYDQADVDAIDAFAPGLTDLNQAINTYKSL